MEKQFHMRLERNDTHDCYLLYPCGHIGTPADVQRFGEEYVRVFEPLGRKVDVIIVLDMFSVAPAMMESWNILREAMAERFTRLSVRVSSGGNLAFYLHKNPAANISYLDYEEDTISAFTTLNRKRAELETPAGGRKARRRVRQS